MDRYECHPRLCIACDKQIKKPGRTAEERRTEEYCEDEFVLSNGSRMRVGVCRRHKALGVDRERALEAIKEYWRKTVRPSRRELMERFIGGLRCRI